MSREFNYKRAWKQYVVPRFKKLSPEVMEAYKATALVAGKLQQGPNASPYVQGEGLTPKLQALFDAVPIKELANASETIYYYGHLSPEKTAQEHGLYWKFQSLCYMSLINREDQQKVGECRHQAKAMFRKALDRYNDHVKGTEYGDDEVIGKILSINKKLGEGIVQLVKVVRVNFSPDVFCIGLAHMRLSTGMFLDPNVAPCRSCGMPYADHTSQRAMVIRTLSEDPAPVEEVLKEIKEACSSIGVAIDGFVTKK